MQLDNLNKTSLLVVCVPAEGRGARAAARGRGAAAVWACATSRHGPTPCGPAARAPAGLPPVTDWQTVITLSSHLQQLHLEFMFLNE